LRTHVGRFVSEHAPKVGLWLLLLFACFVSASDILIIQKDLGTDFGSFYSACKAAELRGDVYDVDYLNDLARESGIPGHVYPYLYPPFFAFVAAPFCALSPSSARILWTFGSIVLLSLSMTISVFMVGSVINRHEGDPFDRTRLLRGLIVFAILLLWILPFRNNFRIGQVNILVLTFIVLSLYAHLKKADIASGVFLSFAVLIKVTPLVLLLYFIARRRYRAVLSCCTCVLLLAAATLPLGAFDSWHRFFGFLPSMSYGAVIPGLFHPGAYPNFSIAGFFSRLFVDNRAAVTIASVSVIISLISLLVFYTYHVRNEMAAGLLLTPFLVLMVISAPLAYLHHVIYIFPGALLLLSYIWMTLSRHKSTLIVSLLLLVLLLVGMDFPIYYDRLPLSLVGGKLFTSMNLYLLLALFCFGFFTAHLAIRSRVRLAPTHVGRGSNE
jgi:alpha-1,2-mannosyltransferase